MNIKSKVKYILRRPALLTMFLLLMILRQRPVQQQQLKLKSKPQALTSLHLSKTLSVKSRCTKSSLALCIPVLLCFFSFMPILASTFSWIKILVIDLQEWNRSHLLHWDSHQIEDSSSSHFHRQFDYKMYLDDETKESTKRDHLSNKHTCSTYLCAREIFRSTFIGFIN